MDCSSIAMINVPWLMAVLPLNVVLVDPDGSQSIGRVWSCPAVFLILRLPHGSRSAKPETAHCGVHPSRLNAIVESPEASGPQAGVLGGEKKTCSHIAAEPHP